MSEAEVGWRARRKLREEAGGHGRLQGLRQAVDLVSAFAKACFDVVEVAEAEGTAKDSGLSQGGIRLLGKMGGATLNQSPHRRWQQALGIPGERPDAVYFLDKAGLAIGADLLGQD